MLNRFSRLSARRKEQENIGKLIERVRRDPNILAAILFGSFARGEETPHSDLDVCLVLYPSRGVSNSKRITARRLRYLDSGVDIHFFQLLPLYVQARVLKEGKVIFARNEDLLYEVALRAVRRFEDFKPIYEMYLKEAAGA